jgi:hypothetical protein
MARRSPPRKVTYFEPVPPRLGRNTVIESTFESAAASAARCGSIAVSSTRAPLSGRYRANGTRICPSPSIKRSLPTGARPQRGLSARGPNHRRAPRGRRRISKNFEARVPAA